MHTAHNGSGTSDGEEQLFAYLRAAQSQVRPKDVARRRDAARHAMAGLWSDLPGEDHQTRGASTLL